jgi:hypothetical protein
MLPRESLRRADVVGSIFFMVLGAVVIWRASQMPWASAVTGASVQWYLSPGLFPAVVGTLLILFSARVLVQALREGGHRGIGPAVAAWLRGLPRNRPIHRVAIIIVLMGIYVFAGVGRIDYLVASSLFLFVTIAVFWWPGGGRSLAVNVIVTALVAVLVPLVVSTIFSKFLYVPMP